MYTEEGGLYAVQYVGSDSSILMPIFQRVAQEMDWQVDDQMAAYVDDSVYFALTQLADGAIVGGVQVVMPNDNGFPIETAWPEIVLRDRPDVCDFALTVLSRDVRAKNLHWLMHAEAWRQMRLMGISTIYAEIPPRVLRAYQRLGMPFEAIGEMRMHWGENTYPCRVSIEGLFASIRERAEGGSEMHKRVLAQAIR